MVALDSGAAGHGVGRLQPTGQCPHLPALEATNNRAERALRPPIIARKLSCGNKTQRGKTTFEILASLAATCHQRGQDFVETLRPYLTLLPTPVR